MKKREKTAREAKNPSTKRRVLIGLGAGVVVLALVAGGAVWFGNRHQNQNVEDRTRTATVEKTSLVSAFVISGTLGYGDVHTLGGGGGVVTKIPQAGDTIKAGEIIMEVEGVPVFLLSGELPLWRDIAPGVSGPDVASVRAALASLGLDAGQPGNQTYDDALSAAIAVMYSRAGHSVVPPSSTLDTERTEAQSALNKAKEDLTAAQTDLTNARNRRPSQSAIVSADNDVNEARRTYEEALRGNCASVCTQADIVRAQEALNLAQATRNELDQPPNTASEQAGVTTAQRAVTEAQTVVNRLSMNTIGPKSAIIVSEPEIRIHNVTAKVGLTAGDSVLTWTRPVLYGHVDLTEAQRRLISDETKAIMKLPDGTEIEGEVGGITESRLDPQTNQTIPAKARISIADPTEGDALEVSAITVSFIQDEVEESLVVPVTALMALAEGGYCVELVDGTLIRVEIGLVADTRVQVFSDQLNAGDEVIVP
ncbi:MAG: hypothetical protein LBG99_09410 [Propionibacteriaceae bacterium]|jgi:hypothetical protein|nr:hypothetical protein [Propionibacteriaceae bacterium]